jgi:transcriptional regulator with XRE-family HTH domain
MRQNQRQFGRSVGRDPYRPLGTVAAALRGAGGLRALDGSPGDVMRGYRISAGFTQRQLALRSGVGLRTLRDIERGRVARPQTRSLQRLIGALLLTPAQQDRVLTATHTGRTGRGLRIGVLGPLVVHRDGVEVRVGSAMLRRLLAVLALHAPRRVARGELIDLLWGACPPASHENLLNGYAAKLRRLLGPDGSGGVLMSFSGGYGLRLDGDQFDLARFEQLCRQAQQEREAGRG